LARLFRAMSMKHLTNEQVISDGQFAWSSARAFVATISCSCCKGDQIVTILGRENSNPDPYAKLREFAASKEQ
jgi:hypothetical protein